MRFVAQEPFYLHHRLRGQLTQHLQLNGVVERCRVAEQGNEVGKPGEPHSEARWPGKSRSCAPASPSHPGTSHLPSEDIVVGDFTGPFWAGQQGLA